MDPVEENEHELSYRLGLKPYDPLRAANWWVCYWSESFIRLLQLERTGKIDLIYLPEGPTRADVSNP